MRYNRVLFVYKCSLLSQHMDVPFSGVSGHLIRCHCGQQACWVSLLVSGCCHVYCLSLHIVCCLSMLDLLLIAVIPR